jgi:hypothetical protein
VCFRDSTDLTLLCCWSIRDGHFTLYGCRNVFKNFWSRIAEA